jgi:hypothetical protein
MLGDMAEVKRLGSRINQSRERSQEPDRTLRVFFKKMKTIFT